MTPVNRLFYVGANPQDPKLQYGVTEHSRAVHSYVVGSSRAGKSKMLLDWIIQDIMAGRGCAVIDPKGDLIWDVLAALASLDEAWWPAIAQRLTVIDPSDASLGVTINPLENRTGMTAARIRQEVFSIFRKVWGLDDTRMPRMDLVLKRTLHLLGESGTTLADIPRLLTDEQFRESLLAHTHDSGLQTFWHSEFPTSEAARFQWTSGILTRAEGFLDDPIVRSVFGARNSSINFADAMSRGDVVLISLSRGRLGEESSQLFGGFLTAMIQLAAESRQSIWPPERRRRFYVYCDEFHGYMVSSSLRELLSEGRGYGLSLIIAHQNLSQLDVALRDSILANANIRVAFRVNHQDAETLSREMFRVRGDRVKERSLQFMRIGRFPVPYGFNYTYYSASEEGRQNREALHHLPDRQFWVHVADKNEILRLRTVEVPSFNRRISEERIERFMRLLQQPPTLNQSSSLPRILGTSWGAGGYHWTPPTSPLN